MARLPLVGSDVDSWGDVLNEFLAVAHNPDGTAKEFISSLTAVDPASSITLGTTPQDVFPSDSAMIKEGFTVWHPTAIVWVSRGSTAAIGVGEPVLPYQSWEETEYKGRVSIVSDTASTPIPRWKV